MPSISPKFCVDTDFSLVLQGSNPLSHVGYEFNPQVWIDQRQLLHYLENPLALEVKESLQEISHNGSQLASVKHKNIIIISAHVSVWTIWIINAVAHWQGLDSTNTPI